MPASNLPTLSISAYLAIIFVVMEKWKFLKPVNRQSQQSFSMNHDNLQINFWQKCQANIDFLKDVNNRLVLKSLICPCKRQTLNLHPKSTAQYRHKQLVDINHQHVTSDHIEARLWDIQSNKIFYCTLWGLDTLGRLFTISDKGDNILISCLPRSFW